ncbi:MAG: alpha/beta hydrolase [Chloroflexi bacterium]|nr:alpha/beta hydrolase [Chloroflexota bacterium]
MVTRKVTDKFIKVNGLRLHYLDWGNDAATPVIMLHGLRGNAREWGPVARRFADKYHMMAFDQRGRGDSDWSPTAEYHTAAYVSDLEQIVEQLGLRSIILIGHSMGGGNALVYASQHPDRVRAAVLIDMGPRLPGAEPPPGSARIAREMETAPQEFASWEEAVACCRQERPLSSEEALTIRSRSVIKELPNGKLVWKYDLQGIRKASQDPDPSKRIDLWPHVRSVKRPTLVMHGEQSDIFSRESAKAMADANRNIRWVDVPRADHYLHEANVEFFNKEVEKFFASLK